MNENAVPLDILLLESVLIRELVVFRLYPADLPVRLSLSVVGQESDMPGKFRG